jgi:hypothetical protein
MALGDDYIRHRLLIVTEMLERAVVELTTVQTEIQRSDPPPRGDDRPPRTRDEDCP